MRRSFRKWVLNCCLTVSLGFCPGLGFAHDDAKLLQQWNNAFLDAIRQDSSAPGIASRKMAILYGAMFDAVNSLDPRFESYLDLDPTPKGLQPAQVAVGVAMRVGELEYPGHKGIFRQLMSKQLNLRGGIHSDSLKYGKQVADQFLAARSNDGSSHSITYIPQDEIGVWKRTPPKYRPPETPQWSNVQSFCIAESKKVWAPGPPDITSEDYAKAWKQVRDLGGKNSTVRTEDQTEIAHFWSCFTYTATPAGHWNQIACNLLVEMEVPLVESLRLLALMNLALADAGIYAWKVKYDYHFWRPWFAIRLADEDGNSLTRSDSKWISLLEAPPHLEYVSGHSTYTGAAGEIIHQFFGTDEIAFTATSDSLPGVTRSFKSITECEQEIGISRIYGGIHFIFSNLDGLDLGHRVGRDVHNSFLRPLVY
ncbi:MAG: vanadium-dependent haloperoxidase [Verrucomicrobia bacterium]|nr:vanadium-dependent haloperoxidase [Verrucomicrobiota bacterium]